MKKKPGDSRKDSSRRSNSFDDAEMLDALAANPWQSNKIIRAFARYKQKAPKHKNKDF